MAQRLTTRDIPALWASGRSGRAAAFSTDGIDLYSYNKRIGTTIDGRKVLAEYRAPWHYISHTTSKHVGMAAKVADNLIHPTYFKKCLEEEV